MISLFLSFDSFFNWKTSSDGASAAYRFNSRSSSLEMEPSLMASLSSSIRLFYTTLLYVFVLTPPCFIRFRILFMLSLLQSNFVTPTRLRVSATRFDLMQWSSGESGVNDGAKLTSRSQGFRSESIKTSKPSNSKQFVRYEQFLFIADTTGCSPAMRVFKMTS